MWRWAWRTPQAWGWAQPTELWRLPVIAMWVRTFVICESSEATSADKNSLHRFADQIGFTDAGLRLMGWKVAAANEPGEVAQPAEVADAGGDVDEVTQRRLRRTVQ